MQTAKPEGQERGRCCKTDTHTHSNEHTRAYPSPAPSLPSLWPMTKTGETYTQKMMNTRFHPQSDRISLSLSLSFTIQNTFNSLMRLMYAFVYLNPDDTPAHAPNPTLRTITVCDILTLTSERKAQVLVLTTDFQSLVRSHEQVTVERRRQHTIPSAPFSQYWHRGALKSLSLSLSLSHTHTPTPTPTPTHTHTHTNNVSINACIDTNINRGQGRL